MAIKRLISVNTNGTQQEYSGIATSAGSGSADELPRLDSTGKLDASFMPTGFGQDAVSATAGETFQGQSYIARFLCTGTESTQQLNTLAFNAVKKDAQDLSGVTIGSNDVTITKFT